MSELIKLTDAHGYTGHATASKMLWGDGGCGEGGCGKRGDKGGGGWVGGGVG